MCSIKRMGACTFCPHDDKCKEERERVLSKLCFEWWNFNIMPPECLIEDGVCEEMMKYIDSHPEKFRGACPQ